METIKTKSLFSEFTQGQITGRNFLREHQASLRIKTNSNSDKQSFYFALNQKDGCLLIKDGTTRVDVEINEYNGDLFLHFGDNIGWECSIPKGTTALRCNQRSLVVGLLNQLGYQTSEDIAVKLHLEPTRIPMIFAIKNHEKI